MELSSNPLGSPFWPHMCPKNSVVSCSNDLALKRFWQYQHIVLGCQAARWRFVVQQAIYLFELVAVLARMVSPSLQRRVSYLFPFEVLSGLSRIGLRLLCIIANVCRVYRVQATYGLSFVYIVVTAYDSAVRSIIGLVADKNLVIIIVISSS